MKQTQRLALRVAERRQERSAVRMGQVHIDEMMARVDAMSPERQRLWQTLRDMSNQDLEECAPEGYWAFDCQHDVTDATFGRFIEHQRTPSSPQARSTP